jgi:hypothetical protein
MQVALITDIERQNLLFLTYSKMASIPPELVEHAHNPLGLLLGHGPLEELLVLESAKHIKCLDLVPSELAQS